MGFRWKQLLPFTLDIVSVGIFATLASLGSDFCHWNPFGPNPEMATSRPRIVRQRINVPQATYTVIMACKNRKQSLRSFAREL